MEIGKQAWASGATLPPIVALVNLDSYFERIGYGGVRGVSLASLRALVESHSLSAPFENLDVIQGLGVRKRQRLGIPRPKL
jgi:hypothetical protein